MAHLSGPGDGRGNDRGQLLLVAVLVLAASFIVLALVINSAIFTENLATREDVAGSEEALEYRAEVVDAVGETVIAGNEDETLATQSELENHAESEIRTLRALGSLNQAIRGGVIDLDYQSAKMGERIAQDNRSRNLTDRNETADWTLAEDVTAVRNVQFELTDIDTTGSLGSDSPFRFVLDDGGVWQLSVSSEGGILGSIGADEVEVVVQTPAGNAAQCVRDEPTAGDPFTIDVTGATVNGEQCHALNRLSDGAPMWLGTGLNSSFDMAFENGDRVNGSYSMVIESGTPDTASLHSGHDPDEPYIMSALYGVVLSYAYQSHAVTYETDVRVAPGEVPP